MSQVIKIYLILSVIIWHVAIAQDEDLKGWHLRKDKNNIQVYTRTIQELGVIEFKVIGLFECTPDDVLKHLRDVNNLDNWMENTHDPRIIKVIDKNTWIDYSWSEMPWPLWNRDAALLKHITIDSAIGTIRLNATCKPDAVPLKEGLVRINHISGTWHIIPQGKSQTKVIYQLYGDPEINLPKWVLNMFVVDKPYTTFENLGKLVNK